MGFRCGFLGLLHLEIVQERLEREFDQSIIMTVPSVEYHFELTSGEKVSVDNPLYYPDPATIETALEVEHEVTDKIVHILTGSDLDGIKQVRVNESPFENGD